MRYSGPWLDLGEQFANRLKILKRIGSIIFSVGTTSFVYDWGFDFTGKIATKTVQIAQGGGSEWGIAEWGTDGGTAPGTQLGEWSGGLSLRIIKFPATGTGQYMKLGFTTEVTSTVSIQQLEMLAKIGKLA